MTDIPRPRKAADPPVVPARTGLNPDKPMWTAEERARMCGCGRPEEHSDDRTVLW